MKTSIIAIFVYLCILCQCQSQIRPNYDDSTVEDLSTYLWIETNQIWEGSFELRIKELIERGAEIDYIYKSENPTNTPFLNAAGALETLKRQSHYTAEELEAVEWEAVKIVKYLVKKGANIHAVSTSRKLNALHLAACGGREKMIPVLVDMGLDINSRDSTEGFGVTVLLHAMAAGDLATVKAVVAAGADINLCALDGNSPLDYAIAYARSEDHQGWMPYKEHEAIAAYMKSLGAQHGKNDFTGYLYFDESKKEAEKEDVEPVKEEIPIPDIDYDVTYGTMTDQDGNSYKTITIGTQTWMAENLRSTTYNDGTAIPYVADGAEWSKLETGAYCIYNNSKDVDTLATYGCLYNWYAVNKGMLAPKGWHIPTASEWMTLFEYLGGEEIAGGVLKENGSAYWASPNVGATNKIGFSALPGGRRGNNGKFYKKGERGFWWSVTEEYSLVEILEIFHNYGEAFITSAAMEMGFSVRCVKD